jgi:hypothetical protein
MKCPLNNNIRDVCLHFCLAPCSLCTSKHKTCVEHISTHEKVFIFIVATGLKLCI